jgi:acyl-CoA reductase-like NAD-dependent aldehyde dehydrogenase
MNTYKMLLNGELVDAVEHTPVLSPVTEKIIGYAPAADAATMDRAIAGAARAYDDWRLRTHAQRRAVLQAISAALTDHGEELATILVQETGRPVGVAQFEVGLAKQFLDYYGDQELNVEVLAEDGARRVELHRKPLGVVGAIVPWNAPLYLAANKIAPALIAGNTIVIKPPPTAPLTTLRFGELIAGVVPPGVVNIISGDNEAGAHLVASPTVAKVAFTGSTPTGRAIMASASSSLKRLTLELGGNDAAIVPMRTPNPSRPRCSGCPSSTAVRCVRSSSDCMFTRPSTTRCARRWPCSPRVPPSGTAWIRPRPSVRCRIGLSMKKSCESSTMRADTAESSPGAARCGHLGISFR